MNLIELTATEAAGKIRDGGISSEELVQACLDRIAQVDDQIEAWAYLNPKYALEQARALDDQRRAGGAMGPLHGIPVGIKDIFKKSISAIQWFIKIGKHLGSVTIKSFNNVEFAEKTMQIQANLSV